jgi:rhamnosyltransferase
MSVGIIILSFNGLSKLKKLLDYLLSLNYSYNLLVIDSSSTDGTLTFLKKRKINHCIINNSDFNHGYTREFARKIIGTDIVVFLTQDVIPINEYFIEKLIEPILLGEAAVTYGRQIPHDDAEVLEAFPREFNYGCTSNIRSIADTDKYGVYTFFCSDSCSAYLNIALDEIGGFRATLTWEDYFATARLLINGYKVAYVAEAMVKHSHNYSLLQEFQRYFDAGYVRSQNEWLNNFINNAEERGILYMKLLIKKIIKNQPILMPYAIIQSIFKWVGYRMGIIAFKINFPVFIKKFFSGQKYYWNSKYYTNSKVNL